MESGKVRGKFPWICAQTLYSSTTPFPNSQVRKFHGRWPGCVPTSADEVMEPTIVKCLGDVQYLGDSALVVLSISISCGKSVWMIWMACFQSVVQYIQKMRNVEMMPLMSRFLKWVFAPMINFRQKHSWHWGFDNANMLWSAIAAFYWRNRTLQKESTVWVNMDDPNNVVRSEWGRGIKHLLMDITMWGIDVKKICKKI